jgi:hypothetical protein
MKTIPSSFCTICTYNCSQELVGFLLSLSLHHRNAETIVLCDTKTKEKIENMTPKPLINLKIFNELDKYTNYNRDEMVRMDIWDDFQMAKADVITHALNYNKDTMFLDSDTIILDTLYIETNDGNKQLGVSPQFIQQKNVDETGYYNGGMLWTNQKSLPNDWKIFTKSSRYYDQASIEDLVHKYSYFEFEDNYNLQTWRFILGLESSEKIASYVNVKNNKLFYKDKRLKFIHTHFNSPRFKNINDFLIQKLKEAYLWKELSIIYRVINDKWVLTIPKQPLQGLFFHKNDSYRELSLLFKLNNKDVNLAYKSNSSHCWLEPNLLLYDRPTLEWLNNECYNTSLILLGNGDINVEGLKLKQLCPNLKPWIFWPRRPMVLEKILKTDGILGWNDREIESIFIGNFENNVQQKFRKTNDNWENVLTEYHCTAGQKHLFTQKEYLMKLRNSKYGLCLRGYGSKCHREVELMAFGTVPIVTKEVSIESYYDKPIENVHYIKVDNSSELKYRINNITQNEWEYMSNSCYEWYQRNVHSKNAWNNMIHYILYDK